MTEAEMNKMFSPFPKMSMAQKGRKTIHYLQQLKDEGTPIVQHCPAMLGPMFIMAAEFGGVDICRLPPSDLRLGPDEALKLAPAHIGAYRGFAQRMHINYVTDTVAFASKEDALANFSNFTVPAPIPSCPWASTTELKFVADNYAVIYGHVGAISGWQTMGLSAAINGSAKRRKRP